MAAIVGVGTEHRRCAARRAQSATVREVARELGRAASMVAALAAWGALLLLLVA